jgi:chromosome segregation ATPase
MTQLEAEAVITGAITKLGGYAAQLRQIPGLNEWGPSTDMMRKQVNAICAVIERAGSELMQIRDSIREADAAIADKQRELYELHPQVQAAHDGLDALVKQKRTLETQIAKLTA